MRMALVTTLWGRPALSRLVLEYTAGLRVEGVDLVPVAAWSPEDEDLGDLLSVPGWTCVAVPNMPISDKWNAAAMALERMDVDAMMILGSDDFVTAHLVRFAADAIEGGAEYMMPKCLYFYSLDERAAFYAPQVGRCGGGRTISTALLERLDYRPWVPGWMRLADGAMDKALELVGKTAPDATLMDADQNGAVLLAVKSARNEHSYEKMKRGLRGIDVDARDLLDQHIPHYADRLWNLPSQTHP